MEIDEVAVIEDHGTIDTNTNSSRRKTPLQIKTLESLYSEDNYPTQGVMKDYAAALGLTYKQVRRWFFERRRKEKNENGVRVSSSNKVSAKNGNVVAVKKIIKRVGLAAHGRGSMSLSSKCNRARLGTHHWHCFHNHDSRAIERERILNEDLLTADYILKKVFRKDGPALGLEFDSLPSSSSCHCTDPRNSHPTWKKNQTSSKRRKVSEPAVLDQQFYNNESAPGKRHGMGKGLMTVWRATNPNAGDFPTGIDFADGQVASLHPISTSIPRKSVLKKKKPRKNSSVTKWKSGVKLNDKKKPSRKRGKMECNKGENQKKPNKEKCELALGEGKSQEHLDQFAMLMDDEELELQESQAGPNPVTCSTHLATNGLHGCSLCKDLLARFPPNTVKMKQPFCMQPWDSSPELVKKLFKVLHFLYTYSVVVDICPFTLDEFAQAFHDEDSMLLAKVHLALLNLLLSDVETEISSGFLPHVIKNCKFLGLLQSVEKNEFLVKFWKRSLNPLTWIEILRQVLVAAGFGSKKGSSRREALHKELNPVVKYGLRPGTLKGELFSILLNKGNNGMKVSDLAKCVQISELNLAGTTKELELLIYSTLSSDITLYEKISSSSYRLRINSRANENENENFQSDTDDSGSIDDDSKDSQKYSSSDDSDSDSGTSGVEKLNHMNNHEKRNDMLTIYTEIDESYPGEVWLLGLMEGEYSDLSIEEKLNALMALVDLVSGGSSIKMEDLTKAVVEYVPNTHHYGSGAKIKRSYTKQHNLPPAWSHFRQMLGGKEVDMSSELRPVDSSTLISKCCRKEKTCGKEKETKEVEAGLDLHPMQSVFLGLDRRYNRYWLFLGPCNSNDPGHKRVYFESSEDGHWEVIDTEEAFCALLSVLDGRGKREAFLLASLEKRKASLCQEMSSRAAIDSGITSSLTQYDSSDLYMIREDSSSPVSDIVDNPCATDITNDLASSGAIVLGVGKKGEEQKQRWHRLQEFDAWIWSSFYSDLNAVKHGKRTYLDSLARCESCHDLYWRDEKHCKTCHTTFELDFDLEEKYAIHIATCREKEDGDIFPKHKVLSSQLQSLKAAIHAIESVMPEEALVEAWSKYAHKLWVRRLRRPSHLTELLQVLADFVAAINEDWLCQSNVELGSNSLFEEVILSFPAMPQTSSSVALWLVKLDALIAPHLERVQLHSRKRTRN